MNNFCPNCGKKVRPGAKFCPYCGQSLATSNNTNTVPTNNAQPVNVQQAVPVATNRENVQPTPNKPKSKKALIWTILIFIVLCVGGYFIYQHYQTTTNDDLVVNKMSKKQLAGLTIAYAHKTYPKNKIWNDAYNQAVSGNVEIIQRKKYSVGNTEYQAGKDSYVYVVNKKAVFTMSKAAKNSDRRITIADDKKVLGQVKVIDAYKTVKKDNDLSKLDHIELAPDINNRQLAVLVTFYRDGDSSDTRDALKNSPHNYGKDSDEPGFYSVATGGDGVSEILFKLQNNRVIIKYLDATHAVDNAHAKQKTIQVALSNLIDKYYSTPKQRAEVDSLANQLSEDNDDQDEDDQSSSSEKQSSESQSSSSRPKSNNSSSVSTPFNLKPFTVPNQLVGKWYSADSDGKVSSLVITNNSINGKPLYQNDNKITNSSKFMKSSARSKIYIASMNGGYVEYEVYGVDSNKIKIKDGHLVQDGNGGEIDYYRTPQQAKNNPSE